MEEFLNLKFLFISKKKNKRLPKMIFEFEIGVARYRNKFFDCRYSAIFFIFLWLLLFCMLQESSKVLYMHNSNMNRHLKSPSSTSILLGRLAANSNRLIIIVAGEIDEYEQKTGQLWLSGLWIRDNLFKYASRLRTRFVSKWNALISFILSYFLINFSDRDFLRPHLK